MDENQTLERCADGLRALGTDPTNVGVKMIFYGFGLLVGAGRTPSAALDVVVPALRDLVRQMDELIAKAQANETGRPW